MVAAHQALTIEPLDQLPKVQLNSSDPCHLDLMAVDLSVPPFQFLDKRDVATRLAMSESDETALLGRAL